MNPTVPFEDDDINEEVKNMITLGLLKLDWADGLNRQEALNRFQRILSTGEEPSCNLTRSFDDDNVNEEIKKMRDLGLLDSAAGFNRREVHDEFEQIHREVPSYNPTRSFDDDNVNEEIKNMRDRGLLDSAAGFNRREAHGEFEQIHREVPSYNPTRSFDDDNVNEEIKNMRDLGLLDSAAGFNRREAQNKSQQILSARETREGAVGSVNEGKRTPGGGRGKKFKLKRLSPEDLVFKQFAANFKDVQSIKAIQIVTNEMQQKIFESEQKVLKDCHGDFNLNIKDLYHGTVVSKDDICTHGLDLRLSRQGCFGKGIYFSDDIKKCEKYLSKAKRGSIYVCSVILGDMKEYPLGVPDTYLKTEPKKSNGEIYNSVKGNMDGFNEYVIYENRRSLIKYRIVLEDDVGDDDDEDDDEEPDTDELDDESNSILQEF